MPLGQQIVQLLTESPGTIVYHLVTLFALQIVAAISLSQWRRDPENKAARRMAAAAAAIFFIRLALLVLELFWRNSPETVVTYLPPLEQGLFAVTAVLLVWAFIPHPRRYPSLGNVGLIIGLLVVAVMGLFLTQAWLSSSPEATSFAASSQAVVWSVFQIVLLGLGSLLTFWHPKTRWTLRPLLLLILLFGQIGQLTLAPIFTTEFDIPIGIRLGYFIAFPLWAALAYRHAIRPLLDSRQDQQSIRQRIADTISLSGRSLSAESLDDLLFTLVDLVEEILNHKFVAIALVEEENDHEFYLATNQHQTNQRQNWKLNLDDWPAFRLAIESNKPVTLQPEGLGARQLHNLYTELGSRSMGAMFVCPSATDDLSLLLLLAGQNAANLSEEEQSLADKVARFAAQMVSTFTLIDSAKPSQTDLLPGKGVSGRIIALEDERKRLQKELATTSERLQQAEARAAKAAQQSQDLAATLEELDQISRDEKIRELETEIEMLRESLVEAEEAMALASAGEGGLSTEWVMMTITRYSGQLEKAEDRIQRLEMELAQREHGPANEIVTSLAQELRQPMTSIAGYTDFLLDERIGILGMKQRDFLQRIRANTERLGALLDQIVQITVMAEPVIGQEEKITTVSTALETAVSAVITQVREKGLFLDIDIGNELPPIPISRNALGQIMTSLLGNACQATGSNGRVCISAHTHTLEEPHVNGNGAEGIGFLQLTVSDSGSGVAPQDQPYVFNPRHRADNPLIAGLGDTGVGLSVARTLVEANGGRIWVNSEVGVGSTFSTLFPIAGEPADEDETLIELNGR